MSRPKPQGLTPSTAEVCFRRITAADVDELFLLRSSVRENPFSVEQLAAIGITPESVREALGKWLEGYLCEVPGRIVGFAMADLKARELSVIAVLSDYERKGIGRELLRLTEGILWDAGYTSIWLWTGPDRTTRAYHLYKNTGWIETEIKGHQLFMAKNSPGPTSSP